MTKAEYFIFGGVRGAGRTQTLVEGCLKTGAVLVCHSHKFAEDLKRRNQGLKTAVFDDPHKLQGVNWVLDHFALEELWRERERELRERLTNPGQGDEI